MKGIDIVILGIVALLLFAVGYHKYTHREEGACSNCSSKKLCSPNIIKEYYKKINEEK